MDLENKSNERDNLEVNPKYKYLSSQFMSKILNNSLGFRRKGLENDYIDKLSITQKEEILFSLINGNETNIKGKRLNVTLYDLLDISNPQSCSPRSPSPIKNTINFQKRQNNNKNQQNSAIFLLNKNPLKEAQKIKKICSKKENLKKHESKNQISSSFDFTNNDLLLQKNVEMQKGNQKSTNNIDKSVKKCNLHIIQNGKSKNDRNKFIDFKIVNKNSFLLDQLNESGEKLFTITKDEEDMFNDND